VAACLVAVLLGSGTAHAWIYPEHRDIAARSVIELNPQQLATLTDLWNAARLGHEARLCADPADASPTVTCIDWAALSAIAGDHSCSSAQLLETATDSDWILKVARVAQQLKLNLADVPVLVPSDRLRLGSDMMADAREMLAVRRNRAERANALRTADTRMQRADAEYATRAAANNAHFLLARSTPGQTAQEYADRTLLVGSEVNAIGIYAWFHLSALQKASRLANESLDAAERQALARAMLFDEAFALHFLEDAFASGHVAGTWGDASQRKGTHDYYNQNGLETFTWSGSSTSIVLMGDAHMREEDLSTAASDVAISLGQVLDVASGHSTLNLPHRPAAPPAPDDFDVCRNNTLPERPQGLTPEGQYRAAFVATLNPTPIPGLGSGLGALPRFRSELGLFAGLGASLDTRWVNDGFEASQTASGGIAGADVSFKVGVGLEGALGDASDGLVFASLGFHGDTASTNRLSDSEFGSLGGNLSAAIPARTGLATRLRAPFYVLPGDLLLLSPMYFFNPETYTNMAVTAVNGGLIPWQQGIATPFGRFQFVLGRELGITFYGLRGKDQLVAPATEPGGTGRIVNFKSTSFELPIAEFRLYRAFTSTQSSSLMVQFFGGVDIPYGEKIELPVGAPPADLQKIWFFGARLTFDWRYYF